MWKGQNGRLADLGLLVVLATAAAGATILGVERTTPYIYHFSTYDYWFDGDTPRFVRTFGSGTGFRHPLLATFLIPLSGALRLLPGIQNETAVTLLMALLAAISISLIFMTFRILGLRRIDSVIFTSLAAVSAAAVFWFPVPETYAFGAVSSLPVIMVLALSERGISIPLWGYVLASTATLSVTITNGMVGLFALFVALPWRRALLAASISFGLIMTLWSVHTLVTASYLAVFDEKKIIGDVSLVELAMYVFNDHSLGLINKAIAFFFHSMIAPEVREVYGFRLSVQDAVPGGGGVLGVTGTTLWIILLVVAFRAAFKDLSSEVNQLLLLSIAGQLLLSLVFGIETFLYSVHWVFLLVLLCGTSARTTARRYTLPLAALLIPIAAVNNVRAFENAASQLQQRYENEALFTAGIQELTLPDSLVICGRNASAGCGGCLQSPDYRRVPAVALGKQGARSCFFSFDGTTVNRHGWIVRYEDWSLDLVEILRCRGARYLAIPYTYGLQGHASLFRELDKRYRTLERTPTQAIYDLAGAVKACNGRNDVN